MSATSEQDATLVLSVAKLLGVELDPWQERVLQAMFSAHREPAPVRGPCSAVYDNTDPGNVVWCTLPRGHTGPHRAGDSVGWYESSG